MQKLLLGFLVFSVPLFVNANPDGGLYGENPEECKQKISIMTAYYKQKAYKDAAPAWRFVLQTCPQSTKNIYIIGAKIMEDFIAQTNDPVLKEKYIDSLLLIHDLRMQHFPENRVNSLKAKKAKEILSYRAKTNLVDAFNLFESAILDGIRELEPIDFEAYLYCYKLMVQNKNKTCGDMNKAYFKVSKELQNRASNPTDGMLQSMQKITNQCDFCLDCKSLDSLYFAAFEENKNDTTWLDNGIDLLSSKKCNTSESLLLMLEKRFATKPSAKTASILGSYFYAAHKKEKAEFYFDKAIDLENSNEKKGVHFINKAKLYLSNNQYSMAKSWAQRALNFPGTNFDAYLIMGDAVANSSSSCKNLSFGGKELYWLAVDYFSKAANAASEASDKAIANKRIAKYSAYFPEKKELFLKSLSNGNTYKVECWISESTTVRSK